MAAVSSSFRTHCLSPSRIRPVDAPSGQARYARMLPELPAFEADEAFLRTIGRPGGSVLIVDTYHHIPNRPAYFRELYGMFAPSLSVPAISPNRCNAFECSSFCD
jgi:hypothetical protein